MAGKRHHYLPQFLQRGFTSDTAGRKTWLYRKNVAAREVGLRDVGVEQNFYSNEGDATVDDVITNIERDEFAELTNNIRHGIIEPKRLSDVLPFLVAHLEVRSRHLRMVFLQISERAWNDMLGYFDIPAVSAAAIREHIRRNPANLRTMAAKSLRSNRRPVHEAPTLAKGIGKMISAMPDETVAALFWEPIAPVIRSLLKRKMELSIKVAHLDALAKSVAPDIRVEQYRALRFTVIDVPSNDLILGDSAVTFEINGRAMWKPFLDKDDDLRALYIPISGGRVILGTAVDHCADSATIRRETARTSHSFFISPLSSVQNVALAAVIGVAAQPLSEDDLWHIGRRVITEVLPQGFNIDEAAVGRNCST
jgi:Protein of unknown function (DUF4238)